MRKYKTVMVAHSKPSSIICDRCKKELINDEFELQEDESAGIYDFRQRCKKIY